MEINKKWIEILQTLPNESNTLDYKEKFYSLKRENGKPDKAARVELAKDVNAFLNSPNRDSSAFILCGVTDAKQIVGLENIEQLDTKEAERAIREYIEVNAKINIEKFYYNNKHFCIIEIDIPFNGQKSRFINAYNNEKTNIDKNSYYFRNDDENIPNRQISHDKEIELDRWLKSKISFPVEVEEFIDEEIILNNHRLDIKEKLITIHNLSERDSDIVIQERDAILENCKRELKYPSKTNSNYNDSILEKYKIPKRVRVILLKQTRSVKFPSYINYIFYGLGVFFLILFIFAIYSDSGNISCTSMKCTRLTKEDNFREFYFTYQNSSCHCPSLLEKNFKIHIDSLTKIQQYEEARLLLLDYRSILDTNSYNYRLKNIVEKDKTISDKNALLEKYILK